MLGFSSSYQYFQRCSRYSPRSHHLKRNQELCPRILSALHRTRLGGGLAQWSASQTTDHGVRGSRPGRVADRCGLEKVTFTLCLIVLKSKIEHSQVPLLDRSAPFMEDIVITKE